MYQQMYFHSLIPGCKVLNYGKPANNLRNYHYNYVNKGRIKLTKKRWSITPREIYERLPANITSSNKLTQFKNRLKGWMIKNITIEEVDK